MLINYLYLKRTILLVFESKGKEVLDEHNLSYNFIFQMSKQNN